MSRRAARRAAVRVLYQASIRRETPRPPEDADPFTRELVTGVTERLEEIDAVLNEVAEGWSVERMPEVDRAILRVAAFELLYRPDVPPGAAISEAVEAAKELSTEDSGRFVNGVLGSIAAGTRRQG